jgi:3D-(3,5/4)-trihydroxycyclohexane-1,2-dione acylhydrolase (decyclizing)
MTVGTSTTRLTVAQALVRFLAAQYTERDGVRQRLIGATWGVFGHGNVAGIGQALLEHADAMPYHQGRNEQAMVHAAVGYARQSNRLSTHAVTTSIGPGATNLVTGAALATINHLPVLLLPGAPTRSCSSSKCRTRATCRSTTACARSPASSTGSPGPRP